MFGLCIMYLCIMHIFIDAKAIHAGLKNAG